jgi:uncharacterized protein (TIGR02996 family)
MPAEQTGGTAPPRPTDDCPEAQLEAALAAAWDRDTLAVYADYLVERGDPRGELIAIDLQLEQRSTPELVVRRASLLTAWLGRMVPSDPHVPWIGDSFRLGFVEDLVLDGADPDAATRLATMLASPLAPYLKCVTVRGDLEHVASTVRMLARERHRWLVELRLECHTSIEDGEVLDAACGEALIAATPRLARLEVSGSRVLATFPHPALRQLRVSGSHALPAMFDDDSLATVTELDYAFAAPSLYVEMREIPPLVMAGLRRLDLSRNDSSNRAQWDEYIDELEDYGAGEDLVRFTPLGFLGGLALREQLTHVTLPAILDDAAFVELQAITAGMPRLEEVTLKRASYYRPPELPGVRLVVPAAWPWPRSETISSHDRLHVVVPGVRSGDEVTLEDAIAVMEQRFDDLPADARYAWTRFWVFVEELRRGSWKQDASHAWTDDRTFPADLLVAAVEACDIGGSGGWRELRDQLRFRRPYPAGAVVTVHCRR